MNLFDQNYVLLKELYSDSFYPEFLLDKLKANIQDVVDFLETGTSDLEKIQQKLDDMTIAINDLAEEFEENGSEIATIERECIANDIAYILEWFSIDIDIEEALRERDW